MADLPFAGFAVATSTLFDTGDRTGEATKLPFPDVPNGFVPGTPVTPESINYALNLTGAALTYLRGILGESLSWVAAQAFEVAVTYGAGLLADAAGALTARQVVQVPATAVSPFAEVWRAEIIADPLPTHGKVRVCTKVSGTNAALDYAITINAAPNSAGEWAKDAPGVEATIVRVNRLTLLGKLLVARKPSGEDADWTDVYDGTPPVGWTVIAALGTSVFGVAVNALWGSLVNTGPISTVGAASDISSARDVHAERNVTADGAIAAVGPISTGDYLNVAGLLTPAAGIKSKWVPRGICSFLNDGATFTVYNSDDCSVARDESADDITVTLDTPLDAEIHAVHLTVLPRGIAMTAANYFPIDAGRSPSAASFAVVHDASLGGGGARFDLDDADTSFYATVTIWGPPP